MLRKEQFFPIHGINNYTNPLQSLKQLRPNQKGILHSLFDDNSVYNLNVMLLALISQELPSHRKFHHPRALGRSHLSEGIFIKDSLMLALFLADNWRLKSASAGALEDLVYNLCSTEEAVIAPWPLTQYGVPTRA